MRTREKVRGLLEEGKGVKEIAGVLGLNPATISYHKRKLGYTMQRKCGTPLRLGGDPGATTTQGHTGVSARSEFGFRMQRMVPMQ